MTLLNIHELSSAGSQPVPSAPPEEFNLNLEGETVLEKFFRLKNMLKVKLKSGEIDQERYDKLLTKLRIAYEVVGM